MGAPALIAGREARLIDVSMGGAMLQCRRAPAPDRGSVRVEFSHAGREIDLWAHERGRQDLADGSVLVRLQFMPGQLAELAASRSPVQEH